VIVIPSRRRRRRRRSPPLRYGNAVSRDTSETASASTTRGGGEHRVGQREPPERDREPPLRGGCPR
jgi:hypothetical protein